jgi:hypothetical protein
MARGHGRILTNIWEDSDFIALTQEQQRLYLFLISQPNLNHAGLLPLTLRRWSRKAGDLSVTELDKHIAALDDARFVVVDDDTEELLVRSFVRNDGVWKQPRVMGAMVSAAEEISSRKLRAALLCEVNRIPLEELSDEPGAKNGPSIRDQVAEHIKALQKALGTPSPTPPDRPARGEEIGTNEPTRGSSATPSGTPSATPSQTPAEGHPQGSTHVRHARADAGAHDARAPLPLSPAPSPSPFPLPTRVPERANDLPDQMTDAWWNKHGKRTAQGKRRVHTVITTALTNGLDPRELWTALERLGDLSKPITEGTLQFALAEIRKPNPGANVIPLRQATSDQRMQQAIEAGRRMQALADSKAREQAQ